MTTDAPQPAGSRHESRAEAPAPLSSRLRGWLARPSNRWSIAAGILFVAGCVSLFHPLVFSDDAAPALSAVPAPEYAGGHGWTLMSLNDLRFVVSVLERNARVLVTSPGRLFDLEHCYPAEQALALGEPVIASSILAIPAQWLFSEPTAPYNFSLIISTLIAAVAMWFLIRDWTGSQPAAITAALLYAFHAIRVRDPVHFYVWDNAWLLLALVFARRLFVAPRWRDAVALALVTSMQIAGSVYPLLVAMIVSIPVAGLFAWTYGLSKLRWGQVALVAGVCGLTAWISLGPFLGLQAEGAFHERADQVYLPWMWLGPDSLFFPGVVLVLLGAIGLFMPGGVDREKLGVDPRWLLGLLLLMMLAIATGGLEGNRMLVRLGGGQPAETWVPDVWSWMRALIPALEVVRSPAALLSGIHALMAVLAGFGAAAVIRRYPPRWSTAIAVVLIAFAWIETLRPPWLGASPRHTYATIDLKPSPEVLAFYGELAEMGNDGPIYELAFKKRVNPRRTQPLITAAYHGRPTSICYNSFVKRPGEAAANRLPDPAGLAELRALGFTTLVVHDPYLNVEGRKKAKALRALAARDPDHTLRELLAIDAMTAYEITATPTAPQASESSTRDPS